MSKSRTWPQAKFGMKEIVPGVFAYQQPDGWCRSNGGLIVGDGSAVVVDTQFTNDLNLTYRDAVSSVTAKPVRYVVNTHHHGDHCYGNHMFPVALTVCHERCYAQQMKLGQPDPLALGKMFPKFDFTGVHWVPADVTFSDGMSLWQGKREIRLLYFGTAHSISDIAVYLPKAQVIFCGDLLFVHNTPLGLQTSFGNWLRALQSLMDLDARYVVPGHGPVCGKEGLEELAGYLQLILTEARRRYDAGMPSHQAALDIELGPYRAWAAWERVVANVERLYHEFAGEEPTSQIDVDGLMVRMAQLAERSSILL